MFFAPFLGLSPPTVLPRFLRGRAVHEAEREDGTAEGAEAGPDLRGGAGLDGHGGTHLSDKHPLRCPWEASASGGAAGPLALPPIGDWGRD